MPEWSELNHDMLVEIAKRIKLYYDFIAFRWVCKSWKSAASLTNFTYKFDQMPWLMLAPRKGRGLHSFYDISMGTSQKLMLQQANFKRCFSSKGWLITIGYKLGMSLLHPFSHPLVEIELPHMKTIKDWKELDTTKMYFQFIHKCVISSRYNTSNYILMVVYGDIGKLAYSRPGDKAWTTIDTWGGFYFDIAYYKEQFYAINCGGKIMVCDTNGNTAQQVAELPYRLLKLELSSLLYMVESGGELLVVARRRVSIEEEGDEYRTCRFRAFKVDILNTKRWTEVKSLGNRAIFVGHNSSVSIEALDCRPNCIYFTDDGLESYWSENPVGVHDMGIYNLQDGSIESFSKGNSYNRVNPPMWVEQSFQD